MPTYYRYLTLLLMLSTVLSMPPASAQQDQTEPHKLYLPTVSSPQGPPNPFGFDLRTSSNDDALNYATAARPKWSRAGDVFWPDVEPVRGGGYNWEALASVEANVQRLRAVGIEPTLIVQRSPSWAQEIPGRLCSPMKSENIGDFVRFMKALVTRYASGPLAVKYWEIWNEPDYAATQVSDTQGVGCWGNPSLPYNGGEYYGNVLMQIYPVIKQANPDAVVFAGALAYFWNDPTDASTNFLKGMLVNGAGNSFDALSFHAYGEWGAGDLLVNKAIQLRAILSQYGFANKPLIATETAATCGSNNQSSCPPDYETWKDTSQANYAARIYAEAIALNLIGAFWFTLVGQNPGFAYSQLIDIDNTGALAPRPSYYAFVNSSLLLQGATYIGPPITQPPPNSGNQVQTLIFRTPSQSTLYVLWVSTTDFPVQYNMVVKPGAKAICTIHLGGGPTESDPQQRLQRYDCSDTNKDGMIPLAINELPMYVEVFN